MSTISDTLLCDASNITGIVGRLLSRGYITREESPDDRRVKMISLTLKGKALRHKLFTDMQQYEMPEFQRLTLRQRTQLREITSTLLRPIN